MTYTSLYFALFVAVAYGLYYVFPKKYRWTVLLGASAFFYIYNSRAISLFILFTIITIYIATRLIQSINDTTSQTVKANKESWDKARRKAYKQAQSHKTLAILIITLVLNFGILFAIKYLDVFTGKPLGILLPLGISFYTFQSTGYLIDVYRETTRAESSPFKLALFISFFPQIIQGPISEFDQLHDQLISPHDLSWDNFKAGAELIIWGLFKKMIIADHAVQLINGYLNNGGTEFHPHEGEYGGTAVLLVMLAYAVQLYGDFSGGIDISRGVSRLFGIDMTVNFRQPYFATSLNDYWRRWHITLGAWMRKYVFYPLATSTAFLKMNRRLAMGLASFVVFLLVGVWHGSNLKYLAFGIWNGLVIMLSVLLEPWFDKIKDGLKIKGTSMGYRLFQMIRTFILVLIGYYFDVAESLRDAFYMMRKTLTDQSLSVFAAEWRSLGLNIADYFCIFYGLAVLLFFSIKLEKSGLDSPGDLINRRSGPAQWFIILVGIMSLFMFGAYGPGYNAADFVYMQF